MNSIVLIGRLTKDPELKFLQTGTAVATFSIAVDRDYKKDGKAVVDFIPIEVMGKAAEFCANYLTKGRLVAIQGQLRIDRYEQNGQSKSFTKVSSNSVKALDWGNKDSNTPAPATENTETPSQQDVQYQAIDDDDIPF